MKDIRNIESLISEQNCSFQKCYKPRSYAVGDVFIDKDKRGKDRRWAYRKEKSVEYAGKLEKVADMLQASEYGFELSDNKLANVMACAETLMFDISEDSSKLKHAFLCKDKMCPVCAWRRSRKNGQIMRLIMERFVQENPKARYIQLTLTAKNVNGSDLSDGFKHLTESWNRLKKYKAVSQYMLGFVRGTEVTYNVDSDTYNHHLHVLVAVSTSYFTKGYLSHDKWTNLWQKALKVDYSPVVYVQNLYEKELSEEEKEDLSGIDLPISKELFFAILETCKYPMKPLNLPEEFDPVKEIEVIMYLVMGLYRKRQMGMGGRIKEIKAELEAEGKDLNEEELINNAEEEKEELKESKRVYTRFYNDYYRVMGVRDVSIQELYEENKINKKERFEKLTRELFENTRE